VTLIQFKSFFLLPYFAMLKEIANDSEDAKMKRDDKINIIRLGIILMLLSCVSACGQKGDLYMPPEASISVSNVSNTV